MNKGFALSLVTILIVVFLAVPVAFFLLSTPEKDEKEVKGVSAPEAKSGFSVTVNASGGTWDLFEVLCKTKDDCLESLVAGREVGRVSGGVVDAYGIVISKDAAWEDYEYMKIFVRSGWGSRGFPFKVTDTGSIQETEVVEMMADGANYSVALIPLGNISTSFLKGTVFSDY